MISDERLRQIAKPGVFSIAKTCESEEMAKELLAYRKAFSEPFCFTDTAGVELCRQGA